VRFESPSDITMTKVYINGKLFDKADAKISVFDHGLLYGDGVFEGIRVYEGKVFRLREHVDRLYDSARGIKLEIPLSREQMAEAITSTVQANNKRNGYIRALVTRGAGYLGLDPRKTTDPQVVIIVDDITLYPPELYENGMEIVTVSTIRNHPNALSPRIKSLNYLNNIMAKMEAIQSGCLEALMLNHEGQVAECTGDNIFIVKRGVLKTPPTDAGILEGVTRNAVLEIARAANIPIQETALTRLDVHTADECFLTGTAAEVIPVVKCDDRTIGSGKPGPITKQLRERFHQVTRQ
jgi:branched-chain amino acid aminotransferase